MLLSQAIQAEKEEDLAALWSLIGAQKIKENKVKLTLFLKKMKLSKIYIVWRTWYVTPCMPVCCLPLHVSALCLMWLLPGPSSWQSGSLSKPKR